MVSCKIPLKILNLTAAANYVKTADSEPVLCLHGWLDNAASFDPLRPHLASGEYLFMDWIGHGKSQHFDDSHCYQMLDFVTQIFDAADHMGWKKFHILGHSLGAAVGLLASGLFPERVLSLISLDSFGPLTDHADNLPKNYAQYLAEKTPKIKKAQRGFKSVEEAANLRTRLSNVDLDSARILVKRSLKKRTIGNEIRYFWAYDPKLTVKTAHPLTEEQLTVFIERVQCPVLFIAASDGLMKQYGELVKGRLKHLKDVEKLTMPGSHHFHMENPELLAKTISDFYEKL